MSEEIKIIDGAFSKADPHKDIGKQKFRVRKSYTAWVEYDVVADNHDEAIDAVIEHGGIDKIVWADGYHNDEPVEVYAQDYNPDPTESFEAEKVAECVPFEDYDSDVGHFDNYEDPEWTGDSYRWKVQNKETA
jgi:hypothetical protein